MPNRILKESICYSEDIEKLTADEEVFFYRLIVNCDDYGRMDARVPILKSRLYQLRDNLKSNDIKRYLKKLCDIGLVKLYIAYGNEYLYLPNWEKHQQVRAKRSKFPDPVHEITCNQLISDDNICHRESESESESNPNQNPNMAAPPSNDFINNVISYLNEKAGTSYKAISQANKKHIQARLSEGFTLDDFKKVIDNKVNDWNHEPGPNEKDMRPYLRPETLFGTKFESYLNTKPAEKKTAKRDNFMKRDYDDDFYAKLQRIK